MNYFYDVTNGFNFFISEIYQGNNPTINSEYPGAGSYVIHIDGSNTRKLYKRVQTGGTSLSNGFQLIVDLSQLENAFSGSIENGDIFYQNNNGAKAGLKLRRGNENVILLDELINGRFPIVGKPKFDNRGQLGEIFNDYENNVASQLHSHAEGGNAKAQGNFAHAEGHNTGAYYASSHAEGSNTFTQALYAHAEGYQTVAGGDSNNHDGQAAHAEGNNTRAKGVASHAEGLSTIASGPYSHAEGEYSSAERENSHAEGYRTIAYRESSHAEGRRTIAYGPYSHAEGFIDDQADDPSIIINEVDGKTPDQIIEYWFGLNRAKRFTLAYGNGSHAEGEQTLALGSKAHAEGHYAIAKGDISHAEGSSTQAYGNYSHAEGGSTQAYGNYSHAEGYNTEAGGNYSHASGLGTIANSDCQFGVGKYNLDLNKAIFMVGNGSDSQNKKNAFAVFNDDTSEFAGTVFATEFSTGRGDYAEFFEWNDQNLNKDDRIGLMCKLIEEKIDLANQDDKIFGIIAAAPAIICDSAYSEWHDKYLKDVFGRIQYHNVLIPTEKDNDGNIIIEEHYEKQPILNPEYDSAREYIPRELRPEWAPVGLLGKLVLIDDGTCVPGGYCKPSHDGIGTYSEEETNCYCMKRLDETHVKVMLK